MPRYRRIQSEEGKPSDYIDALKYLAECLYVHYGQKVVILIDEYDVLLENAYYRQFYEQMIDFIRSLFESALTACDEALGQIAKMGYAKVLEEDGYTQAVCYGLGFFRKQVRIKMVCKKLGVQ